MRTVEVDIRDLDSVERAKEDLGSQIEAVEKDPESIDTPIAFALDLQSLRQSENPEERSLADLVAAVSELRSGLASIDQRLGDPEALLPAPYFEHLMRSSGRLERPRRNNKLAESAMEFAMERLEEALSQKNAKNREKALHDARMALHDARTAI